MKPAMVMIFAPLLMIFAAHADAPGERWIPGQHYSVLEVPQPTRAPAGTVEVIAVFSYTCSHCRRFEPKLNEWLKTKPDYMHFVHLPAVWDDHRRALARLHFALLELNRPDVASEIFEVIRKNRRALFSPDEQETWRQQLQFASAFGIAESAFEQAWKSRAVLANVERARQLLISYRIEATPTIVINGKFTATPQQVLPAPIRPATEDFGPLLELTGFLVAKEHRAMLSATSGSRANSR